ncbi:MAG: hypothetical protein VX223_03365 [Myxococcota bacterium]|nr:hypothetical protein [Myxococcota bacterium]
MSGLDWFFAFTVMALLFVAVAYWSRFSSILAPGSAGEETELDREVIDLQDRKDHLLEDLRDLELDFRMGKIARDEYVTRKARIEPETLAVIRELEARGVGLSPLDDLADDSIDDEIGDVVGELEEEARIEATSTDS